MTRMDKIAVTTALIGLFFFQLMAFTRIYLLELQHKVAAVDLSNAEVENVFLARKLGELHDEADIRFDKQECQTDISVAGFRGGHANARRLMLAGTFEACNAIQEEYLEARRYDEGAVGNRAGD